MSIFFQPDRESTPVPTIFTEDELPAQEEILQFDKKSSVEKTLAETSSAELSVIETPAAGNSNDDSFLSMFASMKVEETKEVITPQNYDNVNIASLPDNRYMCSFINKLNLNHF